MDGMQTNSYGKFYSKEMAQALDEFASIPFKISAYEQRLTILEFADKIVNNPKAYSDSTKKEAIYVIGKRYL